MGPYFSPNALSDHTLLAFVGVLFLFLLRGSSLPKAATDCTRPSLLKWLWRIPFCSLWNPQSCMKTCSPLTWFQGLWMLFKNIALAYNFWRVQKPREYTLHCHTVSINQVRMGRALFRIVIECWRMLVSSKVSWHVTFDMHYYRFVTTVVNAHHDWHYGYTKFKLLTGLSSTGPNWTIRGRINFHFFSWIKVIHFTLSITMFLLSFSFLLFLLLKKHGQYFHIKYKYLFIKTFIIAI